MSDDGAHETRSERLKARRRRYRWAAALCAVMVVGGAATVAAFTVTADPNDRVSTEDDTSPRTAGSFGTDDLPELDAVVPSTPPRAISHDDPLRVWVAGDSLAGALGPALGELNGATGVVETRVDYKISSGLATQVRNWPDYASDALPNANPEVVVFMIGANDVTIASSHDNDGDGTPDWEADYREDVAEMMDLLLENDRIVLWIGSPTMRNTQRDRGAVEVNRVMREEAAKRAPEMVFVDAYRLFEGANGGFSETIRTASGRTIRARIDDGVHLTGDGAIHLADAVFALLDARYGISAQADPNQPLDYSIRHGGGTGSGGSGSGSGSGGGGRESPATTAAPVVEEPPPTTVTETPTTVETVTTVEAPPTTEPPATTPPTSETTATTADS